MNKWAVAYIDFFDNDLQISVTYANNKIEALYNAAEFFGWDTRDFNIVDPDDFKAFCIEHDCAIEAYRL